jgi:Dehydrogenases with different specificities (related to short-chain alcohol dehydrogenases)
MGRMVGKVALVTGAAGGIGKAVCDAFLREGASVAAVDLDGPAVQSVVGHVSQERAIGLQCDITNVDSVRAVYAKVEDHFGKLHVLANVAGGSTEQDGRVTEVPDEEFWRAINLNLFGTFACCKYGLPLIIKAGGGAVINFSSIVALLPRSGRVCYTAAKGGVSAMTRLMAADYAGDKIRVNAIAPGRTITPRTRPNIDKTGGLSDQLGSRHLLGLVDPEDVAEMSVYLASDESRKVTGQIMVVDSGATVG